MTVISRWFSHCCKKIIIIFNSRKQFNICNLNKAKMSSEIKKRWFSLQNKSIGYIISLLGVSSTFIFNSCIISPEYGSPHATFKVNGKVTSKTGETIKQIKVIMSYDSTRTAANGDFNIEIDDSPMDQEYKVQFIDDDGLLNGGEFVALDTVVKFTDPKFEDGDGDWFSGTTSKTLNVKLVKKN